MKKLNSFFNIIAKGVNDTHFAVVCFFAYLVLVYVFIQAIYPYPQLPPAPDGVANITFAEQVRDSGVIAIPQKESLPHDLSGFIIPRSTEYNAENELIIPMSYYGYPVFMGLGLEVFPLCILYTLVAGLGFVSAFFIFYFSGLAKKISSIGALLFGFHPFVLYSEINGFMHNSLFLHLFLSSIALLLWVKNKKAQYFLIPGVVLGFALVTRTSEFVWSLSIYFLILFAVGQGKKIVKGIISCVGVAISILPFILFSFFTTGSLTQYRTTTIDSLSNTSFIQVIKRFIFPFGFDFLTSLNFFYLFQKPIWIWSLLGIGSMGYIVYVLIKMKRQKLLYFVLATCVLTLYIILLYGPSALAYPENISISLSHYRYWLPIFASAPFFITFGIAFLSAKRQFFIAVSVFLVLSLFSISYIFFAEDGLKENKSQNILAYQRQQLVFGVTETSSIILAGRADKYFFPDRSVAGTIIHKERNSFVEALIRSSIPYPVYYYHTEADVSSHYTKEALENAGVSFTYVTQFFDGGNAWEYLYKLDWPNKEKNGNE